MMLHLDELPGGTMKYELVVYERAGRHEATALNNSDIPTSLFHRQWAQHCIAQEYECDQILAKAAYKQGYDTARAPHLQTIRMKATAPARRVA